MDQVDTHVITVSYPATAATPLTMGPYSVPTIEVAKLSLLTIAHRGTSPFMNRHAHLGLQQNIRIPFL